MYQIPKTLTDDIRYTEELIAGYKAGSVPEAQFKAVRVPMGIYEQRISGQYMLRIRCAGGYIAPRQLRRAAEIARDINASHLHVTTREELQIHRVGIDDIAGPLQELQRVGLSTQGGGGNTIRNMICDVRAGIDDHAPFDPYPYCVGLTNRLIAEKDSFNMPRKLKIAFDLSEELADHALIQDLGLIPIIRDGARGFKVLLGGSGAPNPALGWTMFDFLPAVDLYRAAEAAKAFFQANGNRRNRHKARIRYIFYRLGYEETRRRYMAFFDEYKRRPEMDFEPAELHYAQNAPNFAPLAEAGEVFRTWKRRYATPQSQPGLWATVVPLLHGNARPETFIRLADFAAAFGEDVIRFTTRQNIQLRNIPEAYLPNVYALLQELKLDIDVPYIVSDLCSCTGADTCRLGICLSKGAIDAVRRRLKRSSLPLDRVAGLTVNLNGCTNTCALHSWADLGFSGRIGRVEEHSYPAYTVHLRLHGRHKLGEAVGYVAAHDLPAFVEDFLKAYIDKQAQYADYDAFVRAEGEATAKEIIRKYADVPSFDEDKNYYYDWGAEEVFSITRHGKAECSAGLFDIIELDQSLIEEKQKKLDALAHTDGASADEVEALLRGIVFSASRMLLVTRGAEPRTEDEVYSQFEALFIEAGIVSRDFLPVVEAARNGRSLRGNEAAVRQLADTVNQLYAGMDDSLNFKVPEASGAATAPTGTATTSEAPTATPPAPAAEEPKVKKDFRGVACPMNFVKTKIALSTMQPGELLEILLDDGQPIENVPGSVRGEGHQVLSTEKLGTYWKVLIRK